MNRSLPIRALALHQRDIIVGGHPIPAATVFPFFDIDGTVFYLLIVDPVNGELAVCEPNSVRKVPWFQAIQFQYATPLSHSSYAEKLAALLHFDPWWLLKEEPFCDLDVTSSLKKTNCVDDFEKAVTGLYFSGSLTKVTSSYVHSSEAYSTKKFIKHKAMLKHRYGESRRNEVNKNELPRGWRLDPFWHTKS